MAFGFVGVPRNGLPVNGIPHNAIHRGGSTDATTGKSGASRLALIRSLSQSNYVHVDFSGLDNQAIDEIRRKLNQGKPEPPKPIDFSKYQSELVEIGQKLDTLQQRAQTEKKTYKIKREIERLKTKQLRLLTDMENMHWQLVHKENEEIIVLMVASGVI